MRKIQNGPVSDFEFRSCGLEFVSDFDIRILDFPIAVLKTGAANRIWLELNIKLVSGIARRVTFVVDDNKVICEDGHFKV
jgi:hypothetical protein